MTYKINGVALDPQPTTAHPIILEPLDYDGNGRPIMSAVIEYELVWQLAAPSLFYSLFNFWRGVSASGTCVFEAPQINASTYTFYAYSGCILEHPTMGENFEQHNTDVHMRVTNVRPYNVPAV